MEHLMTFQMNVYWIVPGGLTIRFRFTGRSENNNEKYGFVDKINTEKE
jgi:hypothetical protein